MLKHVTKNELVFNKLRDMIYSGELRPGEKVSAIEIANLMGVSRTPVNEAVRRLVDRRLVSILPNVGFEVTVLPWEDIVDLMQLKMILEQTAIAWIRDRGVVVDTTELRKINDEIVAAVRQEDRLAYNDAVRRYHCDFIALAGSGPLLETFLGTWDYSGWEDTQLQEMSRELAGQCEDHTEMLDAIDAQDFDRAISLSRTHGQRWLELFRQNMPASVSGRGQDQEKEL